MSHFTMPKLRTHAWPVAAVSTTVALAACLVAPPARGHAIWFAQRAGQMGFIFGLGADDEDMVSRLPRVTSIAGYDSSWKQVPTRLETDGALVLVQGAKSAAVVTAAMDYGLWSKLPNGHWVAKGRDEVPNAILSEKNYKYAVRILGPLTTPIPALPRQALEVVPVSAQIPALKGEPMKLRVLLHGKPIAGVQVLRDFVNDPDGKPIVSGADGTLTIRVRNQGLNVIDASYDGPPEDPKKETRIDYEATLSFVLAHKPE